MKKTLIRILSVMVVALISFPSFAGNKPFCVGFDNSETISWVNETDHCEGIKFHWTYDQCNIGKYYIMYTPDPSTIPYYCIGEIDARNTNNTEAYDFTDIYACPGLDHTKAYYKVFMSYGGTLAGSRELFKTYSPACNCTNKTTTRCNGLPSLSISGSDVVCTSSPQSYSLSSSYPAIWSITSGSGVTLSVTNPTIGGASLTSTSGDIVTLNANIFGCANVSKTITSGTPTATFISMTYQSSCMGFTDWDASFSPYPLGPGNTYLWSINGSGYSSGLPYYNEYYNLNQSSDPSITLNVKYQNTCGTGNAMTYPSTYYSSCGGFRIRVSPNPVKDVANLNIEELGKPNIRKLINAPFKATVSIYNQSNILVKRFVVNDKKIAFGRKGLQPGRYIIEVTIGAEKLSTQVIIE